MCCGVGIGGIHSISCKKKSNFLGPLNWAKNNNLDILSCFPTTDLQWKSNKNNPLKFYYQFEILKARFGNIRLLLFSYLSEKKFSRRTGKKDM